MRVPAGRCRPRVGFVCGWHRGDGGPARSPPPSPGNNISSPRFPRNARVATSLALFLNTSPPPSTCTCFIPFTAAHFVFLFFFSTLQVEYHPVRTNNIKRDIIVRIIYRYRGTCPYIFIVLYGTLILYIYTLVSVPAAHVIESISLEKNLQYVFIIVFLLLGTFSDPAGAVLI